MVVHARDKNICENIKTPIQFVMERRRERDEEIDVYRECMAGVCSVFVSRLFIDIEKRCILRALKYKKIFVNYRIPANSEIVFFMIIPYLFQTAIVNSGRGRRGEGECVSKSLTENLYFLGKNLLIISVFLG